MLECVCLVLQNNSSLFNLNNCFELISNIEEPIQLYIYIYDNKLLDNVTKMCDMMNSHYKDINYKIINEFENLISRDLLYILSDSDTKSIISNTELLNSFKTIMTPLNVKVNLNSSIDSQKQLYEIIDLGQPASLHIKKPPNKNINLIEYDGEKTLDVEIMVNNELTPVKWIGKKQRYYQNVETNTDSIVLIQQYFIHPNKERCAEIDYCLSQNINNPYISKIILLNEEVYKNPLLNNDKIKQINIQRRLKFSEILRYIKYELKNTNVIFSNSDMFFDDSLKNIHMGDFISNKSLDTVCRFEFNIDKTLDQCVLRENPRFHSQDAWIIHSSHVNNMDIKDIKQFDFQLGVPACDQKVVAEFDNLGYNIYNNPNKIKGYHYHSSQLRDYDPANMLPTPYGYILPIIDNRTKHNDFIVESKLFWQYPVITEKAFFEQNWKDNNYLPIPWATIIDKFPNLIEQIIPIIKKHYKDESYYTCCQTIYLDKLIPLMKACNVTKIFTPHKCKGIDRLEGITLLACPLYAVNVEDSERNYEFKDIDLVNRDTKYLYSFKGAWEPHYISDIRKNIFDMSHQDDTFIENIGKWHFLNDVYTNIQTSDGQVHNTQDKKNRTSEYNQLLLDSKFSLCPSGAGPSSIRFWESLAVGCIPVLLTDTLELPKHEDWDKAILRVSEENVTNLEFLRDITDDEIIERRLKCIEIYNHFKDNYKNNRVSTTESIKPRLDVVVIHSGYKDYLKVNLEITGKYNHIYLIGDESVSHLGKINNVTYVDVSKYRSNDFVKNLRSHFINYSTNSALFEWLCFERVFILKQFISDMKIDKIFHIDSDNILLEDINNYRFNQDIAYLKYNNLGNRFRMSYSIHCALLNKTFCEKFTKLYTDIYINKTKHYLIKDKIDWHKKTKTLGGICDMTLYCLLITEKIIKIQNLSEVTNDYVFMNHLGCSSAELPEQYNTSFNTILNTELLKIDFKDNTIFDKINNLDYRLMNIHFQGVSKKLLEHNYEELLSIENYSNIPKKITNNKKKMVLFTNCHGEKYIKLFERDSNIKDLFDIDYIVSYQQLNNFDHLRNRFVNADVLIINNIKKYDKFTLENIKKNIKKDCMLIVIPFVRFEGYWLPENYKNLKYFKENSVSYFPDIKIEDTQKYLSQKCDSSVFLSHFNNCLKKLKQISDESDIDFYDFFINNHLKYPMFRDNYHPTKNIIEYISNKIINIISKKYSITYVNNMKLEKDTNEYGHYKPIKDFVKNILNIEYNLDKIFIWSRYQYINKILDYEVNKNDVINDLDDMYNKLNT